MTLPPFLKYLVVGSVCTVLDAGLFILLMWVGWHTGAANVVSYGTGIIAHFFLNRHWTFSKNGVIKLSRIVPAVMWGVMGIFLSTGIVTVCQIWVTPVMAKGISIIVMVMINYAVSSRVLFISTARRSP